MYPTCPRCPSRLLPIGKPESAPPELKKFLQLALLSNFLISIQQDNPKELRSASYVRYEVSKSARTVKEFYAKLRARGMDKPFAQTDLEWDYLHGYITFPHNTSSTDPSVAAHNVCAVLLSSDDGTDDPEHAADIASEIHSDSFQDIVKALWPEDNSFSLDTWFDREQSAHAIISELTVGNLPEPTTYNKATDQAHPERDQWKIAIDKEIKNLVDRGTWEYVPRASLGRHKHPIRCKYVFKKKRVKDAVQSPPCCLRILAEARPGLRI